MENLETQNEEVLEGGRARRAKIKSTQSHYVVEVPLQISSWENWKQMLEEVQDWKVMLARSPHNSESDQVRANEKGPIKVHHNFLNFSSHTDRGFLFFFSHKLICSGLQSNRLKDSIQRQSS